MDIWHTYQALKIMLRMVPNQVNKASQTCNNGPRLKASQRGGKPRLGQPSLTRPKGLKIGLMQT